MEKWKPLRASHFSIPPTAKRYQQNLPRYANNEIGAKIGQTTSRAGSFEATSPDAELMILSIFLPVCPSRRFGMVVIMLMNCANYLRNATTLGALQILTHLSIQSPMTSRYDLA